MHASITIENQQIRDAIWAVLESGGKMVRPALFDFILRVERKSRQEEVHAVKACGSPNYFHVATMTTR